VKNLNNCQQSVNEVRNQFVIFFTKSISLCGSGLRRWRFTLATVRHAVEGRRNRTNV